MKENHDGQVYRPERLNQGLYDLVLKALQTASKKSELGKNTSDDFKEYERQREEAREAFYEENFNMSYSDYLAFEEQQMPNIWRRRQDRGQVTVPQEYSKI